MPGFLEELDLEDDNCGICGERFTEWSIAAGDVAEMYDPARDLAESRIVHAECGLARGWEVA